MLQNTEERSANRVILELGALITRCNNNAVVRSHSCELDSSVNQYTAQQSFIVERDLFCTTTRDSEHTIEGTSDKIIGSHSLINEGTISLHL